MFFGGKLINICVLVYLVCLFLLMGLFNYSEPWQLGFQAAGSPVLGEIVHLHAEVLFILVLISTVVIILFSRVYVIKYPLLSFCEGGVVEMV